VKDEAGLRFEVSVEVPDGRRFLWTGARPQCWGVVGVMHDGVPWWCEASIQLIDRDELNPGETGYGLLIPLTPSLWTQTRPGHRLELRDGEQVLARVRVDGVLGDAPA
jgi:hypothetical protein